uniref:sialoadhesin-like n=1 Tax=Solea senegalensis TaxID=28829 RepID=UPI001CD90AE8|nr:sialoadhesin-like [Solea senegalensis]
MSVTTAAGGLLLVIVQVIQGHSDYAVSYTSTEVCALRGSTVDLSCTYTYPLTGNDRGATVVESFWFIKKSNGVYVDVRSDPDYSDRVEYACENNNKCTLRIKDLRDSDASQYMFRFITNQPGEAFNASPGVTLSVADLQVQVSTLAIYSSMIVTELACQSSCRLPDHLTYIWYKNQQKKKEGESYSDRLNQTDSVSCAVKGHERISTPSVLMWSQRGYAVNFATPVICAFRGSTVDISCTYTYPHTVTQVDLRSVPDSSSRVEYLCGNNKCTLRIKDLRESDATRYKFKFITNQPEGSFTSLSGVTLSVADPQLQLRVRRSVSQDCAWTELTCHSSCPLSESVSYVWYNNGERVGEGTKYLLFEYFRPTDSYHCAIRGRKRIRSPSMSYPSDAPQTPSVSASPSGEIAEGHSLTLACTSAAKPAANYTWYKKNRDTLQFLTKEKRFLFRSIKSSDSGQYQCTAENYLGRNTANITISVKYTPRRPSVSVSPSGEIMEGSSVSLACSSDANPAAIHTWFKENRNGQHRVVREGTPFVFRSIQSSDSGQYHCRAQNKLGWSSHNISIAVSYAPRPPSVSVSPSGEIVEGSSVNLTCSTDANPAATCVWYKNQRLIKGAERSHFLSPVTSNDRGMYECKCENKHGCNFTSNFLNVHYAPKPPSVAASPSGELVKGSSVTLTCSTDANPAATYTWHKENSSSVKASGHTFTISDITAEHGGNYYCQVQNRYGHSNTSLKLFFAPVKSPYVNVNIIRPTLLIPLLVPVLVVTLYLRMKKSRSLKTEANEIVEMMEVRDDCSVY